MMVFYPPLFSIIAIVGCIIVFALPQIFQATLTAIGTNVFGGTASVWIFLALPITTVITWYCYDYGTPSNFGFIMDSESSRIPYQRGLSAPRYLMTFGIQALVTVFSFCYANASSRGNSRKPTLLVASAIAALIGVFWGYRMAMGQLQFL